MQKRVQIILNEDDIKEAISKKYHCDPSGIEFITHSDDYGSTSINAIFEENTWDMAMRISEEKEIEKR